MCTDYPCSGNRTLILSEVFLYSLYNMTALYNIIIVEPSVPPRPTFCPTKPRLLISRNVVGGLVLVCYQYFGSKSYKSAKALVL